MALAYVIEEAYGYILGILDLYIYLERSLLIYGSTEKLGVRIPFSIVDIDLYACGDTFEFAFGQVKYIGTHAVNMKETIVALHIDYFNRVRCYGLNYITVLAVIKLSFNIEIIEVKILIVILDPKKHSLKEDILNSKVLHVMVKDNLIIYVLKDLLP